MFKLFLKMYGFLIATLVVSFYIQTEVIDYFRGMSAPISVKERFAPTFFLIEEALKPLPRETWSAKFSELKQGFSYPATLSPLFEIRRRFVDEQASGDVFTSLGADRIVAFERPEGGFFLAKKLRNSDLGVVLEFPGPRDMRTMVYLINWSVEFVLVALLLWFWVRPFWRDLMALHAAAEKAGEGNLDVAVQMRRHSPLYQFALGFNSMTQRIDALLKAHKNLTNSVSHELRTPLARLRFSQHLAQEEASTQGKDRYLALMERDIDELDELSSELLTYAKLERGMPDLAPAKVIAEPWVNEIVLTIRHIAAAAHKIVRVSAEVRVGEVICEPRYMERAISNLMRNAVRFAESEIHFSISRVDGHFVAQVDDDGPGIPADERVRLFEPFARIDRSRDRATGGFGMGLAIVKQIAVWHGGGVTIEDSALGGARITLVWPVPAIPPASDTIGHLQSQTGTESLAPTV